MVQGRETDVRVLYTTLQSLREDFKHNLNLIDERDTDLEVLENENSSLRAALSNQEDAFRRKQTHLHLQAKVAALVH